MLTVETSSYSFSAEDDYELRDGRSGFVVETQDKRSYIRCYEGYNLDGDSEGEKKIEQDVLYVAMVSAPGEGNAGIGTILAREALREAKKRGFRVVRAEIENPRIAKIIVKLQEEGMISDVKFAIVPRTTPSLPSQEIFTPDRIVDAPQVLEYLSHLPLDDPTRIKQDDMISDVNNRTEVIASLS